MSEIVIDIALGHWTCPNLSIFAYQIPLRKCTSAVVCVSLVPINRCMQIHLSVDMFVRAAPTCYTVVLVALLCDDSGMLFGRAPLSCCTEVSALIVSTRLGRKASLRGNRRPRNMLFTHARAGKSSKKLEKPNVVFVLFFRLGSLSGPFELVLCSC
jgi:hypothetical protein